MAYKHKVQVRVRLRNYVKLLQDWLYKRKLSHTLKFKRRNPGETRLTFAPGNEELVDHYWEFELHVANPADLVQKMRFVLLEKDLNVGRFNFYVPTEYITPG